MSCDLSNGSGTMTSYPLPFESDTALFVSCSLLMDNVDKVRFIQVTPSPLFCCSLCAQVVVGSNTGELALLDVGHGAPKVIDRWDIEYEPTCSLGCSREVVAINKASENLLVISAAHWIQRRDMEVGKTIGSTLKANAMRHPGGTKHGWNLFLVLAICCCFF